jgi:hypothetical protein
LRNTPDVLGSTPEVSGNTPEILVSTPDVLEYTVESSKDLPILLEEALNDLGAPLTAFGTEISDLE